MLAWDKLIGSLLTGWAVPGIEMARARFRLQHGTGEPLAAEETACGWRAGEREDRKR